MSWKILWRLLITCHSIQVLKEFDRPIVYSLSPGTSVTPAMAKDVIGLVNMYRITGDDWDTWKDVKSHFDIARCLHRYILLQHICICLQSTSLLFYFWIPYLLFHYYIIQIYLFDSIRDFSNANMIGNKGLMGKSWPDLDMLPFGWLTDPGNEAGMLLFLFPLSQLLFF